ncbi:MAG: hypothetical protein AAGF97_03180, partial [Planctomycetota bacterium]
MKGPSSATRFLLFILLACLCAAPVSAQLNQFTGTNSSDYNDPGNWLLGTVPVGGETAVIGEGAQVHSFAYIGRDVKIGARTVVG